MRTSTLVVGAIAGSLCSLSFIALAGDIAPPVGPVAGTMKTLDQVEPRVPINATTTPGDADSTFRIDQPGSYYLTDNIVGEVGKMGIEIASSDVSLDLMGFALLGVPGSLTGIDTSVTANNVRVNNGVVQGWGEHGVEINGAHGGVFLDIRASANAQAGFRIGDSAIMERCSADANGATGITVGRDSVLENCTADGNGGAGYSGIVNGVARNCTASDNVVGGFVGSNATTLVECDAYLNDGNGMGVGVGGSIIACSSYDNDGAGFLLTGIGAIRDSVAYANTTDGILAFSFNVIEGNNCHQNGNGGDGAGIHATGIENKIDNNRVADNDRGIDVDTSGNVITRNIAIDNTFNYSLSTNNFFGAIIDRTAVGTAPVTGNSAPATLGSTDPWANFAF